MSEYPTEVRSVLSRINSGQAVASAEKLGLPVSVERLKRGLPISNDA